MFLYEFVIDNAEVKTIHTLHDTLCIVEHLIGNLLNCNKSFMFCEASQWPCIMNDLHYIMCITYNK